MFETVSYTEAILVGVLAVWFGITVQGISENRS